MPAPSPRKTRRTRQSTTNGEAPPAPSTRAPRPRRKASRASASSESDYDLQDDADGKSNASSAPSHADLVDASFPDALGADVSEVGFVDHMDLMHAPNGSQHENRGQPRGDFFSSGVGALSYAVGPASSRTGHGIGGPVLGPSYKPVARPANGVKGQSDGPSRRLEPSSESNATTATTTTSASDKENDGAPGVGAYRRPGKVPPSEAPPKRSKQAAAGPSRNTVDSPSVRLGDDLTHLTISTPSRAYEGGPRGVLAAIMSPLMYVKEEVVSAVRKAEDEARANGVVEAVNGDDGETPRKRQKGKGKARADGLGDDEIDGVIVSTGGLRWGRGAPITRYCLFLAIPVIFLLLLLIFPGAPADPLPTPTPGHSGDSASPDQIPVVTPAPKPLPEAELNVTSETTEMEVPPAPSGAVDSFFRGLTVGFARLRTLLLGDYATRADLAAALEKLETRVVETTTRVARDAAEAKEAAKRAEEEAREAAEDSKAAAVAAAAASKVKPTGGSGPIVWDAKLEDRLRKLVEEVAPVAAVARKGPDGHWIMDTTFYEYLRARLSDGVPSAKGEGGFVTADAKGWRALLDKVEGDVAKFVDERARDMVDGRVVERDEVVEIVRRQMEKEVKDGAVQKALEKFVGEAGIHPESGKGGDDLLAAVLDRHLALYGVRRADMPDYAAESTGGSVVRELTTGTYMMRPTGPISGLFGWVTGVGVQRFPPAEAIRGGSATPGECWAMRGTYGNLTIRLSIPIHVTSFTVEHLPPSLAPNPTEGWKSAPRNISFHAIVDVREFKDTSGASGSVEIARTTYDPFADAGWKRVEVTQEGIEKMAAVFTEKALARGGIKKDGENDDRRLRKPFVDHVQVRIESNWGNKLYTCIYRVRAHGEVRKMAGALATAGIGNPI